MVDSAGSAVVVNNAVAYDVGLSDIDLIEVVFWSWLKEALVLRLLWSI